MNSVRGLQLLGSSVRPAQVHLVSVSLHGRSLYDNQCTRFGIPWSGAERKSFPTTSKYNRKGLCTSMAFATVQGKYT